MLKDQIKKYENTRRLFLIPEKAVISDKNEMAEGVPFFSLNFPLPSNLSTKITDIVRELAKKDPDHEYVSAPMLHCTIKSFGLIGKQINEGAISKITKQIATVLKNFPSFEVELRGINTFRVASFIQVFSRDGKLLKLHNLIKTAIPYSDCPQSEGKGYVPHITIAYFYHKPVKLFSALNKYQDVLIGKVKVTKLNLIRGCPQRNIKRELIKSFQLN